MNHMPLSGSTTAHMVSFTRKRNTGEAQTLTVSLSVPGGSEDYSFASDPFPTKLHISFLRLAGTFNLTCAEKLCGSREA